MRKKLGRFWIFFVGLAVGLIISFTIGTEGLFHIAKAEASPSDQDYIDQGKVGKIHRKLKEMNKKLEAAIEDYKNDVIEEEELEKRIKEIHYLRLDALDLFPKVLGVKFRQWVHTWGGLAYHLIQANTFANTNYISEAAVADNLEAAKEIKDTLEKLLLGWKIE